jgi:hypothetical protein
VWQTKFHTHIKQRAKLQNWKPWKTKLASTLWNVAVKLIIPLTKSLTLP